MIEEKKNCERCIYNVWDLRKGAAICTNPESDRHNDSVGMFDNCDKWKGVHGK